MTRALVLALLAAAACGSGGGDDDVADARATPDAARADASPTLDYCTATADAFCTFYLRCGRMVADDLGDCRVAFAQGCARYDARYDDLVDAGLLTLSADGVAACVAHLATVACEDQPRDLSGPCATMWVGTSPAGAPCGLDVESFVCEPGTTCRLDLSLCGECAVGEPSSGGGAPTLAVENGPCGGDVRCPYRSTCLDGTCHRDALLTEGCGPSTACTAGRCVDGTCAPLLDDGGVCASGGDCLTGRCGDDGRCASLPGACF